MCLSVAGTLTKYHIRQGIHLQKTSVGGKLSLHLTTQSIEGSNYIITETERE